MKSFDDRTKAFEDKYAHEEKMSFEVEARCCKLFGLWVAAKIGLEGADANTYAMDVVSANLEEPGFDDVFRKVRVDFEEKGLAWDDHEIRIQMDKALEDAKYQLLKSDKPK